MARSFKGNKKDAEHNRTQTIKTTGQAAKPRVLGNVTALLFVVAMPIVAYFVLGQPELALPSEWADARARIAEGTLPAAVIVDVVSAVLAVVWLFALGVLLVMRLKRGGRQAKARRELEKRNRKRLAATQEAPVAQVAATEIDEGDVPWYRQSAPLFEESFSNYQPQVMFPDYTTEETDEETDASEVPPSQVGSESYQPSPEPVAPAPQHVPPTTQYAGAPLPDGPPQAAEVSQPIHIGAPPTAPEAIAPEASEEAQAQPDPQHAPPEPQPPSQAIGAAGPEQPIPQHAPPEPQPPGQAAAAAEPEAPRARSPEMPEVVPVRAYYISRSEDTLRSVAAQFLNSPSRWEEVRTLNAAYPGIAGLGADDLIPQGCALMLPGDPMPWGKPDPVYLWTLAERFLYAAWGRDPSPAEVVPFWRGLTHGSELEAAEIPAVEALTGLGSGRIETPPASAPDVHAPATQEATTAHEPAQPEPAQPEHTAYPEPAQPAETPAHPEPTTPPAYEPPPTAAYEPPPLAPEPTTPPASEPPQPAYEPPPAYPEPAPPAYEPAPPAYEPPPTVAYEPPPLAPEPTTPPASEPPQPAYEPPPTYPEPPQPAETPAYPEPTTPPAYEPPPPATEPPPSDIPPAHAESRPTTSAPTPSAPPAYEPPTAAPPRPEEAAAYADQTTGTAAETPAAPHVVAPPATTAPTAYEPPPPPETPPHAAPPDSPAHAFEPPTPPATHFEAPPLQTPAPSEPPPPQMEVFPPTLTPAPATPSEPIPASYEPPPPVPPAPPPLEETPEMPAPAMPQFMPSMTGADPSARLSDESIIASRRSLAGTAIGDAMLLWQLARIRRRRGSAAEKDLDPLEESLKQSARMDSLRLIEAAMRHLRAVTVAQLKRKPKVVAVRVGTYGFEVLLDEPAEAPDYWEAASGGYVLELAKGVTLEHLDAIGQGPSLCPALIPVGDTVEGPLLLNFEEIGCLAIAGPDSTSTRLLSAIVEALGSSPMADSVRVVTVGVETPTGPGWERVISTTFDSPQLEHLLVSASLQEPSRNQAEIDVLAVGPGHDVLIQRAGQIAVTPGSNLAVVGATSSAAARWPWRIHIDATSRAVVQPIAFTMLAAQTRSPDVVRTLMGGATDQTPRPRGF